MNEAGAARRSIALAARTLGPFFLLALPLAFAAGVLAYEDHQGVLGYDFRGTLWEPGKDILAGRSPYPPPRVEAIDTGNPAVYPPAAFMVSLPLSLLPSTVAYWVWAAILAAAVLVSLRLLGVRDWRCYPIALTTLPAVFGIAFGNIHLLLVPLAAYAWSRRDRPLHSGVALAIAVALKIVLWPLLVWLIVTRRFKTAAIASSGAVFLTLVSWAAIGFDGLRDYPHLLRVNTDFYARHSWSLVSGGVGIGLSLSVAKVLAGLFGLALLCLAFAFARRPDGDRRAFCIAVVSSLALYPVVWPYYLVVLLVPVAIAATSLVRLWLLLAALWIAAPVPSNLSRAEIPRPPDVPQRVWDLNHSPPPTAQIAVFTAIVAVMTVALLRRRSGRRASATDPGFAGLAPLNPET